MEALMGVIDNFHLLRPWWLLFIPFWIFICYRIWNTKQQQNGWSSLCEPALLSYLLGQSSPQKNTSKSWLTAMIMAGLMASIALAGPVWKQLPQPVFQATSAMILILDLSRSMDAEDVKPSRLIRAKQKLQDILKARTEGQTGLIVFAGSAFDVVPLTTDNRAILSLLSSLDTSMMPAQGSLASLALKRAKAMFQRGAIQHGSVVMLCDGVDAEALSIAQSLSKAGHQVSVLAVGTPQGAPIPVLGNQGTGGFMKDSDGNIILPRIDQQQLAALARAGDGVFQYIRLDDADVQQLPGLIPSSLSSNMAPNKIDQNQSNRLQSDQWQEEGPWLVYLLLPLCLLAFRRGILLSLLFMPLCTALTWPTSSQALEWDNAWRTPDQQAQSFMQQHKAKAAAKLFTDPAWKAAALYRVGKYDEAAQILNKLSGAENQYNKANALARAGKLKQALKAYDSALQAYADHHDSNTQDAQFNRDLVEKALQQKNKNDKQHNKDKSNKQDQQDHKKASDKAADPHKKNGPPKGKAQKESQTSSTDRENTPDASQQDKNKQAKSQPNKDKNLNKPKSTASKASKATAKHDDHKTDHNADQKNDKKGDQKLAHQDPAKEQKDMEKQHAQQQMLRRIPDDPGGLLRRKFKYQYQNQQQSPGSQQAW